MPTCGTGNRGAFLTPPPETNAPDRDASLVKAIQEQRLWAEPEGRAVCAAISARMRSLEETLTDALASAGVSARPANDAAQAGRLQYHMTTLVIAPGDLAVAAEVLTQHALFPAVPLTPARLGLLQQHFRDVLFTGQDRFTMRVELRLEGNIETGALAFADLAFADLPAPLYRLARPVRRLRDKVRGRRPDGQSDFLGTPDTLILPLLRVTGLGPQDLLIDLGCGDGRVVAAAVREIGCRAVGIEAQPGLADRAKAAVQSLPGARIESGRIEEADLTQATALFMFMPDFVFRALLPQVLPRLARGAKLLYHEQQGLPPGMHPDRSLPVFGDEAVTVAHIWDGPP